MINSKIIENPSRLTPLVLQITLIAYSAQAQMAASLEHASTFLFLSLCLHLDGPLLLKNNLLSVHYAKYFTQCFLHLTPSFQQSCEVRISTLIFIL